MERLKGPGMSARWLVSLLWVACVASYAATPAAQPPRYESHLYLYDQQGVQACSFKMSNGQHVLQDSVGRGCPAQYIYSWRVTGARVGMGLQFYASATCDELSPAYFFVISGEDSVAVNMPADTRQPVEHDGSFQHDIAPHVQTFGPSDKGRVAGSVKCIFINGADS